MEGFAGTLSNRTRPATDGSALAKRRRVYVMLLALVEDLGERGKLDLRKTFIGGTFAPAQRGGECVNMLFTLRSILTLEFFCQVLNEAVYSCSGLSRLADILSFVGTVSILLKLF